MKTYDIKDSQDMYFLYKEDFTITLNINTENLINIHYYGLNVDGAVVINLNVKDAKVNFYYSTLNWDNHVFKIVVNHNADNTISNIYNHGINTADNKLVFDVTGSVSNDYKKCIINQESQIINLKDGIGKIEPNLLIDNYDVSSSHSAYIGKFKDEKIYYLMSRGIRKKTAIKLLIESLLLNHGNKEDEYVKNFLQELEYI